MKQIIGVGCDIIKIDRIKKAAKAKNQAFLKKVFTESEIAYCSKFKDPYSCYAARFAAKEAVVKALGVGFGELIGFQDIEIRHNELKKPLVFINLETLKKLGNPKFEISLSHCKEYAMAYVIAFN